MYVTQYDEHEDDVQAAVSRILTPDLVANLKKDLGRTFDSLWDAAVNEIVDGAADAVSRIAAERAKKFLEAVLAGDVKAAENLFGLDGFDGRKAERPVMPHGRIFEADPIKLRRQLVEAHADLLRDARIVDLEALLEVARKQVVELEGRLDRRSIY